MGKAWTANRLRARSPITELKPHVYRLVVAGAVVDVVIQPGPAGGSAIATAVLRTTVTQSKFLLVIPFGKKNILSDGLQRDLFVRKMSKYALEAGYRFDVALDRREL